MEACPPKGKLRPKATQRRMTDAKRSPSSSQGRKSNDSTETPVLKRDDMTSIAPSAGAQRTTNKRKVKDPKKPLHSLNPDDFHGPKKKRILAARRHREDREQRKAKLKRLEEEVMYLKSEMERLYDEIYILKSRVTVDNDLSDKIVE